MKLRTLYFLLLITAFSCSNKETSKDGFTTIKGKFNSPYKQELELMKIVNGKEVLVSTVFLDDSKEFGFTFKTGKEGFYTIGNPYIEIPLYVKGNEVFTIDYDFSKPNNRYTQTEIPNEENKILYNWEIETDTINYYSNFGVAKPATYIEFFPFYESFINTMKSYHSKVNSSNAKFNKLMNSLIDLEIEIVPLDFIFTPRPVHPNKEQFPSYFSDIIKESIVFDEVILELPRGIRTVGAHQQYVSMYLDNEDNNDKGIIKVINKMTHTIPNKKIQAYYAIDNIYRYKVYNQEYLDYVTPIREAINSVPDIRAKVEAHEEKIRVLEVGTIGSTFTFKDINDKDVSFFDFKGKYVYIDFWATWCSPCKREIPALKKLEKDLHKKDIVFVSISMDKPKAHNKWKEFVKKEGLTGVQLFATDAFNTPIAKDYKINSIPRFIIFDKEGKIVDADAKRPSNPELKNELEELLK